MSSACRLAGSCSHRDAVLSEKRFGLRNRIGAEVKNGGREDGIGSATDETFEQMVEASDASRGNHRHRDRVGYSAQKVKIVALSGAVAVHAGQKQLAGSQGAHALAPSQHIEAGWGPAPMDED